MARFYGVLLIAALVVVSGVIAYVGDIVGRRMGRKRLSLFGLRPRHTAIAISVAAGMLITILTLAVAMLVSPNVRSGLLHVEDLRRQQRESKALAKVLEHDVKVKQAQVTARRHELQAAQKTLDTTKSDLGATQSQLKQAQAEIATRQAELTRAQAKLEKQRAELAAATAAVAQTKQTLGQARVAYVDALLEKRRLQGDITRAADEIAKDRATPIVVTAEQPLDAELVQGGQSKAAIRAQLNRFIGRVSEKARDAGIRPANGGDAVIVGKAVYDPDKHRTAWFDQTQVLDAISDRIHGAKGGVIVRAVSMINTYQGEPIFVDLRLFNNRLVFHKGDVLARATLYGQDSVPTLYGELYGLLKEVGLQARRKNIMPRTSPSARDPFETAGSSVGEMTIKELFAKVDELRKINGPAQVTVVAAADAWTIGPLKVAMRIEPAE